MARFLITGASGLLGLNISLQLSKANEVIGTMNNNVLTDVPFHVLSIDFSTNNHFLREFEKIQPDVIIHCAAIANLDECEKFPDKAYYLNAEIPGKLAYLSKKNGIKLVHISTDAVFDGKTGNYSENDHPEPLSIYAKTKRNGEEMVMKENDQAIITRVNFFGWSLSGNRSLSEFFFNNLKSNNKVNGFTDVCFCPLYVSLLSDLLIEMIRKKLSGIYHVVSSDHMSKYEFGCEIAKRFGFNSNLINPVSVSESNLTAERSKNLTLSTEKLATDLSKPLPKIRDGIQYFYDDYFNGYASSINHFSKNAI